MQKAFYYLAFFIALVFVLFIAKSVLLPLVLALFVWYLIQAIGEGYYKLLRLPKFLAGLLALVTLVVVFWFPVQLTIDLVPQVVQDSSKYQANLQVIWANLLQDYPVLERIKFDRFVSGFNVETMIQYITASLAQIAGNFFLIVVYVAFLLMEQGFFAQKFQLIFSSSNKEEKIHSAFEDVFRRVKTYIWMKTFISSLTAMLSYGIMLYAELDYAAFWAMIVFFLNFIPTVGSILSTLLPSLLALVQFQILTPFLIVIIGVGLVQIIVGNVLEPRLMGQSLNLSPFVIILSLILWSSIWGIIGAFLAVPLMVIVLITLSEFQDTRPIAILMSRDGKI